MKELCKLQSSVLLEGVSLITSSECKAPGLGLLVQGLVPGQG